MAKADYDSENCSECAKLKATAPYKATHYEISEVSKRLNSIPRLNAKLDDDLVIKVGLVGSHGLIDTNHHSLIAKFIGLDITLVLHIVVIQDAVLFRLEQNNSLYEKSVQLGDVTKSPRWIAAAGLACAEQFGQYSLVTNNCHHYCQLLGASMGISVYSFKLPREVDYNRIDEILTALKSCSNEEQ